jgi:glycosyltransferase involved in cell wall biosynthesis
MWADRELLNDFRKYSMRILYIHQYFATPKGRTGTRSYEQARAMMAAGHEVTMLTTSAQLADEEFPEGDGVIRRGCIDGINCIVLDIPYNQTMNYAHRILSFLKFMFWCCWIVLTEKRPDMIYATSTPLTVGIPAMLGKLFRDIPYGFEVRDLWPAVPVGMGILPEGFIANVLRFAERAIYRRAAFLVAVNEDVAQCMLKTVGRLMPMVIAPNACDTDLFGSDKTDDGAFRKRHGLEGKIIAIHPGAMGPVNGLNSILDAANLLRDEPDLRFVIIGKGPEKERLIARVEAESLDNVLILDALPKQELVGILGSVDIGLMTVAPIPVLQMNCANKFFDFLSSGLPIVLNYEGWQARLLERCECGLSSPQGDTEAFASQIRSLACNADLRAKLGANSRKLAETELNRQTIVDGILNAMSAVAIVGR